ncbi:MAG: hypothetical protein P1U61_06525 [Legionellaceae bacterium]|nr:hypothetical protein [Legionellaceae bacterium]
MSKKGNLLFSVKNLLNEFTKEGKQKYPYEVVGIETKENKKILVIQLEGRLIKRKRPEDIVLDDSMIEGLSPKAVRAITYLAVLEQLAPEFQILSLELNQKLQEYIVTLKNHTDDVIEKKSASQVSKDSSLVKKLSPEDANRIGYMAGINDSIQEHYVK